MTEPKSLPADPAAQKPRSEGADADMMRHLRVLEERFMNMRHKAQLTDDKLLAAEQKLQQELKSMNQELSDMRRQLAELQENVTMVSAEMEHAATVHEVKAIEKYLSYWEPMHFITKEELARKSFK